jgi:hypothetical protein
MSLFRQKRPRPFHHDWLYVDERRERLRQIEQQARDELVRDGLLERPNDMNEAAARHERVHQSFRKSVKNDGERQRVGTGFLRVGTPFLLLLLAASFLLLWWLWL